MPLAGRMRLSSFLVGLAGCAVGAVMVGGVATVVLPALGIAWVSAESPPVERPFVAASAVLSAPATAPTTIDAPAPVAPRTDVQVPGPTARAVDVVVLSFQEKDLGSDKRKDVTAGSAYKVNVYQDAGQPTANRAKIDLDRDEKWDEKITFEAGKITRQVAPADDENYTQTFRWVDGTWKAE